MLEITVTTVLTKPVFYAYKYVIDHYDEIIPYIIEYSRTRVRLITELEDYDVYIILTEDINPTPECNYRISKDIVVEGMDEEPSYLSIRMDHKKYSSVIDIDGDTVRIFYSLEF